MDSKVCNLREPYAVDHTTIRSKHGRTCTVSKTERICCAHSTLLRLGKTSYTLAELHRAILEPVVCVVLFRQLQKVPSYDEWYIPL